MLHTPPLSAPSDLQKRKWLLKIPTTFPENQRLRRGQFFFFVEQQACVSFGPGVKLCSFQEGRKNEAPSFLVPRGKSR